MPRLATVEIHPDELHFSAGHFTIFSQTQREDLHGHNYQVSVIIEVMIQNNGLEFDYRLYRNKLKVLCDQLDRRFLLPSQSPFLNIEITDENIIGHYGAEKIYFLKRDALILPLSNITIEELSHWFLQKLTDNTSELLLHHIQKITLKVSNGPGQAGGACWVNIP